MLKIIFGDIENSIYHPPTYFDNQYEDEWIIDPLSIEMIQDMTGTVVETVNDKGVIGDGFHGVCAESKPVEKAAVQISSKQLIQPIHLCEALDTKQAFQLITGGEGEVKQELQNLQPNLPVRFLRNIRLDDLRFVDGAAHLKRMVESLLPVVRKREGPPFLCRNIDASGFHCKINPP